MRQLCSSAGGGIGEGSRVRIQAWALVRLMVTPVFRIFTGSIIRQCEMGQKNSGGGGDGPARDPLLVPSCPTCFCCIFLSPALQPYIAAQDLYRVAVIADSGVYRPHQCTASEMQSRMPREGEASREEGHVAGNCSVLDPLLSLGLLVLLNAHQALG